MLTICADLHSPLAHRRSACHEWCRCSGPCSSYGRGTSRAGAGSGGLTRGSCHALLIALTTAELTRIHFDKKYVEQLFLPRHQSAPTAVVLRRLECLLACMNEDDELANSDVLYIGAVVPGLLCTTQHRGRVIHPTVSTVSISSSYSRLHLHNLTSTWSLPRGYPARTPKARRTAQHVIDDFFSMTSKWQFHTTPQYKSGSGDSRYNHQHHDQPQRHL